MSQFIYSITRLVLASIAVASCLLIYTSCSQVEEGLSTIGTLDGPGTTAPPSGSLDSTFGVAGRVVQVDGASRSFFGNAVFLQPDGKIIVVGSMNPIFGSAEFAVVRFNSDGTLDTTFGTSGVFVTKILIDNNNAQDGVVKSSGEITVFGTSYDVFGRDNDTTGIQLTSAGALDTSFDTDGKAHIDVSPGKRDRAYGIAVQSDGKILVSGESTDGTDADFFLMRLNADGSLDTSFDTDGIARTDVAGAFDTGRDLALLPDGKILVIGTTTGSDVAIVKYNSDGSLDTSFDTDGKVISPLGGTSSPLAIAVHSDGSFAILCSATNATSSKQNFMVVKHKADGSLDTSFDTDGIVMTDLVPGRHSYPSGNDGIAIQSDGKILVVGIYHDATTGYETGVVLRYNTDGSIDTTFGTNGRVNESGVFGVYLRGIEIQADGKIVVAGDAEQTATGNRIVLLRLNP